MTHPATVGAGNKRQSLMKVTPEPSLQPLVTFHGKNICSISSCMCYSTNQRVFEQRENVSSVLFVLQCRALYRHKWQWLMGIYYFYVCGILSSVPNVCALFFIILLNNITDMSHIVSRVTLLATPGIREVG